MRRLAGTLALLLLVGLGAAGAVRLWGVAGSVYDRMTFPAHIAAGLSPRLGASDAYGITLDYLRRASAEAEPGTGAAPRLQAIWAVAADDAPTLDGCIPAGKGAGIVWVSVGTGTYLNLSAHPWSEPSSAAVTPAQHACGDPGLAGTIVIDDATGAILGVYPYGGPASARPTPAPAASAR